MPDQARVMARITDEHAYLTPLTPRMYYESQPYARTYDPED